MHGIVVPTHRMASTGAGSTVFAFCFGECFLLFKGTVCAINAKPCVCNSDNYSGREAPSLKMGSDLFFFTIFLGLTSGLYADWLACHQ